LFSRAEEFNVLRALRDYYFFVITSDRVASSCELVSPAEIVNALRVNYDWYRRKGAPFVSWSLEQKKISSWARSILMLAFLHLFQ
jgi:hypothetical protein